MKTSKTSENKSHFTSVVVDTSEAPNGGAAIQTALSGKPNFILIDFRLPDMNGVELARELRKLPQTEHVPIVGWSADSRNPRRETLRQAGITEYLEKPITLKDLDAVLERFVPKSKEPH